MLTPERWQIAERVFLEALAVPPTERPAFIDSSCASDPELRHEVETLLAAASGSDSGDSLTSHIAEWSRDLSPDTLVGRDIDSYRVVSLLGAGGMGEVYVADDRSLGRRVALKLLPAPFSADPGRLRRFTEEARAASALNHPNIITVYHIGAFEGRRFIATEFIDGETLRDRIARGPLPVPAALDIALQVTRALGAAHDAGIVHRDIKPENIMIRRDGYVKVLDFGLAKLAPGERLDATAATAPAAATSTRAGAVLGTLRYMAPEQAAGGTVDVRADLFSLSVVLHELLVGAIPDGGGESVAGGDTMPGWPKGLAHVIRRGLAADPAARYQTAAEIGRDLDALQRAAVAGASSWRARAAAAIIASVLLSGLLLLTPALRSRLDLDPPSSSPAASVAPSVAPTLAVLPFRTVGLSEADEYLGLGMADAVITQLGNLPQLGVRPTTAVREFTQADVDPIAVGRTLRVDHVLGGLVQRSGDRMRVTVQLVDVHTGAQRWASRIDAPFHDLFALQDMVSQRVADALVERMSGADRAGLAARQTQNPEAYQRYLQGRYFLARYNRADLEHSLSLFQQAVALDPRYALAYAGVAAAHRALALNVTQEAAPTASMPLARDAALKALALDPELPEAHYVLGSVQFHHDYDWSGAQASLEHALASRPNFPEAHRMYGWYLAAMGRFDEGIAALTRSHDQDPTSGLTLENLAMTLHFAGRPDEALRKLQAASELNPRDVRPYSRRLGLLEQLQRFDETIAARQAIHTLQGRPAEADRLGRLYKQRGYGAVLEDDAARGPQLGCLRAAYVNMTLGRRDDALRYLEACHEQKHTWVPLLKVDPAFAPLRDVPRFNDLLRRIGL